MVYAMDQAVKKVLSTLESLGLRENTVIIFSSDVRRSVLPLERYRFQI